MMKVVPSLISLSILATSKWRHPTTLWLSIFSMWSPAYALPTITIIIYSCDCDLYSYLNELDLMGGTVLFDLLYERISVTVIGDGQAQVLFALSYLYFLSLAFPMHENEIIETYLSAKKSVHIYFVCVECAVKDLDK